MLGGGGSRESGSRGHVGQPVGEEPPSAAAVLQSESGGEQTLTEHINPVLVLRAPPPGFHLRGRGSPDVWNRDVVDENVCSDLRLRCGKLCGESSFRPGG